MQNKTIFIVLGMHRSGTSVVTNCLNAMGLSLSDQLVPPSSDNSDGFFEDARLVELNDKLEQELNRHHMTPAAMVPYPDDWMQLPSVQSLAREITEYVSAQLDGRSKWLIKDPRMMRLMPLYAEVFSDLGVIPVTIFVHRHPASIVRSKSNRDGLSFFLVERHWQASTSDALWFLSKSGTPTYFFSYESLMLDGRDPLDHLRRFVCSFSGDHNQEVVYPVIRNSDAQRRIDQDLEEVGLSAMSEQLYALLNSLTGKQNDQLDWSPFFDFRERYTASLEHEQPWMRFIVDQSALMQEAEQNKRLNNRLADDLKKANGRVFGLLESKKQLTVLQNKHRHLESQYRRLQQKQRTKIFKVAHLMDQVKVRIYDRRILRLRRFLVGLPARSRQALILIRRSLNNNGWKATLVLVAKKLSWYSREFLSLEKRRQRLAAARKKEMERNAGRRILLNANLDLDEQQIEFLLDFFVPEFYVQLTGLPKDVSFEAALEHFIGEGLRRGLSPSPLFNHVDYLDKSGEAGLLESESFLHWLTKGVDYQIVPTRLFDEEFFTQRHPASESISNWAFHAFFSHFVFLGSSPNQYFDAIWYQNHHQLENPSLPGFYHYLVHGYKKSWRPSSSFPAFSRQYCVQSPISPMEVLLQESGFHQYRNRFRSAGVLSEQVAKAAAVDPDILEPGGVRRLNIQPFSNPYFPAVKEIRSALKSASYDSIVIIPHCRYGGSGLVAGQLCHALLRCFPDQKVLLVRTDNDDFMRPDWFPDSVEMINLLDYGCDLPDEHRMKLLLDILVGTKPARIINVHSRLAWELLIRYADRLKKWSSLYGYTFCYDVNIMGAKVGYPVKYVPQAIPHLKKLLVDNSFLRNDLISENRWDQNLQDRVAVVKTPFQGVPQQVTACNPQDSSTAHQSKIIFWAGRFDRQKRFDLVIKLAKRNPEWSFWVWGAPMLGDEDSYSKLPGNIKLHGLFKSYAELPLEKCGIWLYTSQWDGVPTLLIEMGLRGIPMVAARIWGTADLISEDTAFPVTEVTNVQAYERALSNALSDTGEAQRRAATLRRLIFQNHSPDQYDSDLKMILDNDKWSPEND